MTAQLHRPQLHRPQLHRLAETERRRIGFSIDGRAADALAGDTLLTAILANQRRLRDSDFGGEPRAGFCLMGACQDCWVRLGDGRRLRACSHFVEDGMAVLTTASDTPSPDTPPPDTPPPDTHGR